MGGPDQGRDVDQAAMGAAVGVLRALLGEDLEASYALLKRRFRETLARDPLDSVLTIVVTGSVLFWLAEKEHNPRCASFFDALAFITTSLSVGYDDVFAKTSVGKAVASVVMTVGPALSARLLEHPLPVAGGTADPAVHESLENQHAILERLDAILDVLKAQQSPPRR